MFMKRTLTIKGVAFQHVSSGRYNPVAVYQRGRQYLRIGPRRKIAQLLAIHRTLADANFPVPRLIASGTRGGQAYYIETSLGEKHFGELFAEDYAKTGRISNTHFARFLAITKRFANAQFTTAAPHGGFPQFEKGIHADCILEELPRLTARTRKALARARERLRELPFALTHGDFNAWNIYPKGVIDFESHFRGPFGYDLAANVIQPKFFPRGKQTEASRTYDFSDAQVNTYLAFMDALSTRHALPKLSTHLNDFAFCRLIWSAARMERWPKLQAWRYRLFEKALGWYLRGDNVFEKIRRYES
jgi:hypothetical protein